MKDYNPPTKVTIIHQGIPCTGYIVSSTDIKPHFHWFLLSDEQLIRKFGDTIAFKEEEGRLQSVSYRPSDSTFINAVKECVEQHINTT